MKKRNKVFIDCDPGIDDCFALLLAMKHLEVVGISTVGGNTGLFNTTRNACYVVELAKRTDIPIYAGYDKPMFTKLETAEEVHGISGLGAVEIREPNKKPEKEHAIDVIIDTFMKQDDIVLVTLGPLTNVAQAILKEPRLKKRIPQILCMGGSVTAGNYSPCAEFNIYADPEAAKIVFDSGIVIKMAGLNFTRQNSMIPKDVTILKNMNHDIAQFAAQLLSFSVNSDRQSELCDACAISWLIDPNIVPCSLPMHVDIETKGEFTRGMTVCDYREYIGTDPKMDIGRSVFYPVSQGVRNVVAAMEFDQDRFKKLLFDTIKSYGE